MHWGRRVGEARPSRRTFQQHTEGKELTKHDRRLALAGGMVAPLLNQATVSGSFRTGTSLLPRRRLPRLPCAPSPPSVVEWICVLSSPPERLVHFQMSDVWDSVPSVLTESRDFLTPEHSLPSPC